MSNNFDIWMTLLGIASWVAIAAFISLIETVVIEIHNQHKRKKKRTY